MDGDLTDDERARFRDGFATIDELRARKGLEPLGGKAMVLPATLVPKHGSVGSKWRGKVRGEFQITARMGDLLVGQHLKVMWQCESADQKTWFPLNDAALATAERLEAFTTV